MKRRVLFFVQGLFLILFIFSVVATAFQLMGTSNPLTRFDHSDHDVYNHIELYDSSLSRLNSLKKLERYSDSIYAEKVRSDGSGDFEKNYTDVVSNIVRNRFYHGYSYYSFSNNYLGVVTSKLGMPGLSALVIPDEILHYPYAACSQQSIVMMEVLRHKGISTRKVAFVGKKYGGHFAFEVLYDGGWHFYDTNLEPDIAVLNSYGRPGIDFLVKHEDVLIKAYNHNSPELILDMFPTYKYGPVNKFPAPRAIIFQRITEFLSYTAWLFFLLAFLVTRRQYLRVSGKLAKRKKTAYQAQPASTSAFYPDYNTQRT